MCQFSVDHADERFYYILSDEFAVGKLQLVCMDDGLAIITLSAGACSNLPLLVLHLKDGYFNQWCCFEKLSNYLVGALWSVSVN